MSGIMDCGVRREVGVVQEWHAAGEGVMKEALLNARDGHGGRFRQDHGFEVTEPRRKHDRDKAQTRRGERRGKNGVGETLLWGVHFVLLADERFRRMRKGNEWSDVTSDVCRAGEDRDQQSGGHKSAHAKSCTMKCVAENHATHYSMGIFTENIFQN